MEFGRPSGRPNVESRPTSPRGTGFQRGLYRLMSPEIPEDLAEAVERKFMATVDNLAKEALDVVISGKHNKWTLKTRSAWSRFVNGLLFRVPERVASARKFLEDFWLKDHDLHSARYDAQRREGDPEFLEHIIESINKETLEHTMKQIDDRRIGALLNNMRWDTIEVSSAGRQLFTSDRPVIMSNGLSYDHSHLLLPVSPTCLFLATNNPETTSRFTKAMSVRELVKSCNRHVVRRAQKFAWNTENDEIGFVRKHLATEADMDRLFWGNPPDREAQLNELIPLEQEVCR